MNQHLINQFVSDIMEELKKEPTLKDTPEKAIAFAITYFTQMSNLYTDGKRIGGVLRVVLLEGATPQTRKIAREHEFALPPFFDDRKYAIGDSISLHDDLDDPRDQLRPTVVQVIHYLYSNMAMDLVVVKSFINNQGAFEDYIVKCKQVGFKTPEEMDEILKRPAPQASDGATPDTTSADAEPAAPGPQIVES